MKQNLMSIRIYSLQNSAKWLGRFQSGVLFCPLLLLDQKTFSAPKHSHKKKVNFTSKNKPHPPKIQRALYLNFSPASKLFLSPPKCFSRRPFHLIFKLKRNITILVKKTQQKKEKRWGKLRPQHVSPVSNKA